MPSPRNACSKRTWSPGVRSNCGHDHVAQVARRPHGVAVAAVGAQAREQPLEAAVAAAEALHDLVRGPGDPRLVPLRVADVGALASPGAGGDLLVVRRRPPAVQVQATTPVGPRQRREGRGEALAPCQVRVLRVRHRPVVIAARRPVAGDVVQHEVAVLVQQDSGLPLRVRVARAAEAARPLPTTMRAGASNAVPGRDATGPSTTFAVSRGSGTGRVAGREAGGALQLDQGVDVAVVALRSAAGRTRPCRCARRHGRGSGAAPCCPFRRRPPARSGVCRMSLAVTGPLPARLTAAGAALTRLVRTGAPLPGRSSSIVPAVTGARRVCRAGASPHGFAR